MKLRRASFAWLTLVVVGCTTPEPEALKELYVEPLAGEPEGRASPLEPWPFSAEDEPRTWVGLRTLRRDRQEGVEKLARALDVWSPPQGSQLQKPVDIGAEAKGKPRPPALLFYLPAIETRRETGCYLGHTAFAVRGLNRPAVLHHVRFMLVNREREAIRIPLASLRCEAVASVEGKDGQVLELDRRAVADDVGQEVEEMVAAPGEDRLYHLFFHSPRLDAALRFQWRVEALSGPTGEPPVRGPWDFTVALQRRYVLSKPLISELEKIVARGDRLPRAPRRADPFSEPRMEPVPPPPE